LTNCHRCKTRKDKNELVGANIFDALTGTHIITRWLCLPCANTIGLIHNEQYPQATNEGDAL